MKHVAYLMLAGLLLVPAPANAIYLATPLVLHASTAHAEVGDVVRFDVEPINESTAAEWAGKTVEIVITYDPTDGSGDAEWARVPLGEAVALDAAATGRAEWTVPAELDDKNVGILLEDADGNLLANADVAIGDAEPMARLMALEGASDEDLAAASGPAPDAPASEPPAGRDAPLGALVSLGAVGLGALALRRRG